VTREREFFEALRHFTRARIGLGRSGHAPSTAAQLDFQLAHALARDAVRAPWRPDDFVAALGAEGLAALPASSAARPLDEYLTRPDRGRALDDASRARLRAAAAGRPAPDVALVVTGGLSAAAIDAHGLPLVRALVDEFSARGLSLAPVVAVARGRVALADDAGEALGARLSVIAVGERPGLSAADGVGLYLTFAPRRGRTDAERNCVSNVRPPDGLDYREAAAKVGWLAAEALRRQLSGVALKDEAPPALAAAAAPPSLDARAPPDAPAAPTGPPSRPRPSTPP
jgi:ethanolamine ammonia-lyase small subunit